MKHTHYIIMAFNEQDERGNFVRPVQVELMASNEKDALELAKQLIVKENYRVTQIIQHDPDYEVGHQQVIAKVNGIRKQPRHS